MSRKAGFDLRLEIAPVECFEEVTAISNRPNLRLENGDFDGRVDPERKAGRCELEAGAQKRRAAVKTFDMCDMRIHMPNSHYNIGVK
ncbi:MAG TPA: hypothetical protein VMU43_06970 [Candidatus Acidoferrum sp.]|nr:hypothetical protein [Candidatus Acidoferrum sp.]